MPLKQHNRTTSSRAQATEAPVQPAAVVDTSGGDLSAVYQRMRSDILSGTLPPGYIVNQVHVARLYGVSRTPVREALRMLQAENLVDAQFQHRMRVTAVSSEEVDSVYATWILMQSLGVALTVPLMTNEQVDELRAVLDAMHSAPPEDPDLHAEWKGLHMRFHRLLVQHAGPIINASIENCWSRSDRARLIHMRSARQSWTQSDAEHTDVVDAFVNRSSADAIRSASKQLARNALSVIASIDPSYEPRAIRQALKLTLQGETATTKSRDTPSTARHTTHNTSPEKISRRRTRVAS